MDDLFQIDECLPEIRLDAEQCARKGRVLLDRAAVLLAAGRPIQAMDELVIGTGKLRSCSTRQAWRDFVDTTCHDHPITALICQDPCTRISAAYPYGGSGDTKFLQYVHRPDAIPPGLSELGDILFRYVTTMPIARSLRARTLMIARTIDAAARHAPLRVLAVMSGHLWEAGQSTAVRTGRIERLLAFDQDADNLAMIQESNYGPGVTTYQGALRPLMKGISVFRNFDLVYSSLCETLSDQDTERLIAGLYRSLAPNGTLLLSNLAPGIVEAGYVEAFMNWNITYRNKNDLIARARCISPESVTTMRTSHDPYGDIVFLAITRTA